MFTACIWFIISLVIFICICANIFPIVIGFLWLIATAIFMAIVEKFSETY